MRGWNKILKYGGILRISVPDFDKIMDIYNENGKDVDTIILPLMGGQDYEYNCHYSIFNKTYLEKALYNSGFREAREWDPLNEPLHQFEDWSMKKLVINKKLYSISINIEGIK